MFSYVVMQFLGIEKNIYIIYLLLLIVVYMFEYLFFIVFEKYVGKKKMLNLNMILDF